MSVVPSFLRPASRLRAGAVGVLVASLLTGVLASVPPASAGTESSKPERTVEFTIMPWLRLWTADHDASPPGANDWDCKPSPQHPEPVVLVHGLIATRTYWATLAPLLANEGYCVFAVTYGAKAEFPGLGGLAPMEQSGPELAGFVDHVLDATGAEKVDLIGHSEGTVISQYYMRFLGGGAKVAKAVGLAGAYEGTTFWGTMSLVDVIARLPFGIGARLIAGLDGVCGSCRQLIAGSEFLAHLDEGGANAVEGVDYTLIVSRYDELVTPYTSGTLGGSNAKNLVVQDGCPMDFAEHGAVAWTPRAARMVLNALDPDHPRAPVCVFTLFGYGALWPTGY